jgi:hypothetical protein
MTSPEYQRAWRAANVDKVKAYNKKNSESKKRWWQENRERILPEKKIKSRKYYKENREKSLKCTRDWQKKHPDRTRSTKYKWVESNSEKARQVQRNFRVKRMADPAFRLRKNLSIRISKALSKKGKKCSKTSEILGCSLDSFRIYLESRFESGMTWENYGKVWHVDHIVPCAIFDLNKPEHQKRCFHFSNLQPLFARDNLSKKDKAPDSHQFGML